MRVNQRRAGKRAGSAGGQLHTNFERGFSSNLNVIHSHSQCPCTAVGPLEASFESVQKSIVHVKKCDTTRVVFLEPLSSMCL